MHQTGSRYIRKTFNISDIFFQQIFTYTRPIVKIIYLY